MWDGHGLWGTDGWTSGRMEGRWGGWRRGGAVEAGIVVFFYFVGTMNCWIGGRLGILFLLFLRSLLSRSGMSSLLLLRERFKYLFCYNAVGT